MVFDPQTWALDNNWSWARISEVANVGLERTNAQLLVEKFGPAAPRAMVAWCESKVVGTCSLAGWVWEKTLEEHRKNHG